MAAGRASFEVQVFKEDHWVTEEVRETESSARSVARTIFSRRSCQGVRIIKNWERSDGLVTESVIFSEQREPEAPQVSIVPIEAAPVCRKTSDYYRLESRITINRLFRKYLEKVYLTPTELIHNYKALQKVQQVDTLFPAAVDRVATIQARAVGDEPKGRRDEVFRSVAQMTQKARKAEEHPQLPTLKGGDFNRVVERVEQIAPPDEVDYYSLVVLSRDLVQHRNWLGKLERLVQLTDPDKREDVLALIDGVVADLVGVPSALQDILGYQKNLAQALCSIADLCEGRFVSEKSDAREQIAVLGPLIAQGRMGETRKALIERLQIQLSSAQPLNRHNPEQERDAFREVANRMFRSDGFLGGPNTAAALTRRFSFMLEGGGKAALPNAIGGVITAMPDTQFRIAYLTELAASELGTELSNEIFGQLRHLLRVRDLDALVPGGSPPRDKLLYATRLYTNIESAAGVPPAQREQMLAVLDGLLSTYLKRTGLIERLDDPTQALCTRATRLVEFCAAGLLPPASKAQALSRERVVALLKQPNFDMRFIDGTSDLAQCEEVLRDFHALLVRAGFR
ncbi:MAG TPA: hypothetical protein VK558_13265 [Patescibacteria group bacterium]|nr:hypothetical protein [Patescibacteria group bacterium]